MKEKVQGKEGKEIIIKNNKIGTQEQMATEGQGRQQKEVQGRTKRKTGRKKY